MSFNIPEVKSISSALSYYSELTPQKIYLVYNNRDYTYSEVNQLVNRACSFLENLGLKQGDIFSMIIKNSIDYIIIYLAGLRLGCPVNPYPFNLEPHEVIRYVGNVNPKLMICQSEHYEGLTKESLFTTHLWNDSFLEEPEKEYVDFVPDSNDSAAIYYSSGTTGNPKSIVFSHRNMMANISSIVRGFRFGNEDVHLIILPLGHTASINYSFLPSTLSGSKLVITESYWKIRPNFWETILKHGVNYIEVVPSILIAVLNTPYDPTVVNKISKLKYVGCGSAPLPLEVQLNFDKKFGIRVANLYGLSETGPTHIDYPLDKGWEVGSIGYPLDVNEIFIVNEDGEKLPPNKTGEIVVRGDNIFTNYYNNKKLYNSVVTSGAFFTGDLGYYDESGKYYFEGRKKDLIIKGGINILPEEIDEVLFRIEEIKEATTVGISDAYLGEKISSFIVLKRGCDLDANYVKDYCRNFLSRDKIPDMITFVDSLPKGPSGKILRKELRK